MSLAEPISEPRTTPNESGRRTTKAVLLLGNDDRVNLAVARGLGREGISVHVAWCGATSPVLKSRYVSQYHAVPPYRVDSLDWLHALNRLARMHEFDLVIPCNDFAVVPLQTERERLAAETNWYLINDRAFRVAFDKAETNRVARALGINVPHEHALTCDEVRELSRHGEVAEIGGTSLQFPVYVKPRSSITPADVEHKRSARRVETATELADVFRASCPVDGLLIQESFAGMGIGVEVLASNGSVLMQIQHRRLRETIDGGSTYRETIADIPELTAATHRFVKALNYTGVAMFEFRHCDETGDWVLLEMNARFWGSLPLAIAAGANFPFGLYRLLVHGRTDLDCNYQVGQRCRDLVKDMRSYRKQRASKFQWRRLLLGEDHLDFFAVDDWPPQLASLREFAGSVMGKLFRR